MRSGKCGILLAAALLISLAACDSDSDPTADITVVEESADAESADAQEEVVIDEGPEYVSYLTGLEVSEEYADRRPVAIMIPNDNYGALPHVGIGSAEIVYQCLAEGGYTRLMAIFDAQTFETLDKIGPIRSSRLYYAYYAMEYDALYMHFGQSYLAEDFLYSSAIDNINCLVVSAYTRDSSRTSPNNAFTSGTLINQYTGSLGYSDTHDDDYTGTFLFADEEVNLTDGVDAYIVTPYYPIDKPWFEYNEEDGLYYRYQYGSEHVDSATGEQLCYKNIIIISVPTSTVDSHGYLALSVAGSGSGYYVTNGKAISITWSKSSETAVTHYYDSEGNELALNTGKTFVCVESPDYFSKVTFEAGETEEASE